MSILDSWAGVSCFPSLLSFVTVELRVEGFEGFEGFKGFKEGRLNFRGFTVRDHDNWLIHGGKCVGSAPDPASRVLVRDRSSCSKAGGQRQSKEKEKSGGGGAIPARLGRGRQARQGTLAARHLLPTHSPSARQGRSVSLPSAVPIRSHPSLYRNCWRFTAFRLKLFISTLFCARCWGLCHQLDGQFRM